MAIPERPLDTFVARDRELEAIRAAFENGSRVVVVTGPGGVGKTRLLRESTAGRGLWVDLAAVDDASSLAAALFAALGGHGRPSDDRVTQLLECCRGYVVLDHVEQMAEPLARRMTRWLEAAPDLRWLLASRVRFPLPGSRRIRLGPLEGSAAHALLAARLAERGLPPMERAATDALLARLDGLPLAVELAAARAEVLGPAQLATRAVADLADGNPERPSRHRSLSRAFAWSWDSLSPTDQNALAELGVFEGPFDAVAAEAVLGPDHPGVLDVLARLTTRSLLQRLAAPMAPLRILIPIRELVAERSPPSPASRARHARHFVGRSEALLGRLDGAEGGSALRELDAIRDELRASLAWAALEDPTLFALGAASYGLLEGAVRPAEAILELLENSIAAEPEREARARAGLTLGVLGSRLGRTEAALEGLRLARESTSAIVRGDAARREALVHLSRGAMTAVTEAIDRARDHDRSGAAGLRERGETRLIEGRAARTQRRDDEAEAAFEEAFALLDRAGAARSAMRARLGLANLLAEQGRHEDAAEAYGALVEDAVRYEEPTTEGNARGNLGLVLLLLGERERAREELERAERQLGRIGERTVRPLHVGYLAALAFLEGRPEEARVRARASRTLAETGSGAYLPACLAFAGGLGGLGEADALERARELAERGRPVGVQATVDRFALLARTIDAETLSRDLHGALFAASRAGAEDAHARLADLLLRHLVMSRGWNAALASPPPGALHVVDRAQRIVLPDGVEIELGASSPARRLMWVLARLHGTHPGRAMTPESLIAEVWPGERIQRRAARNRLNVALSSLRKAGLGGLLERHEGGYRLAPEVPVSVTVEDREGD